MKYEFSLVIGGKDSIKKKIEEPFKEDPKFIGKMLTTLMIPLMRHLNLTTEDDIYIEKFSINPVVEKDSIS